MAEIRLRFTVLNVPPLQGRQIELATDGPISVGRTSDNALVLEHRSVSRSHARIDVIAPAQQDAGPDLSEGVDLTPDGFELRLVDLGSQNGTRVGDKLVTGEQAITPGDILGFGEVRLRFALVEPGAEAGSGPTPLEAVGESGSDVSAAGPARLAGQDPAEAPPTVPMALPALISAQAPATAAERPLSFDDVFAQAGAAAPAEAAPLQERQGNPVLFGLFVLALLAVGGLLIWRIGVPPATPYRINVQLQVNEVLPVDLAPHISSITEIGEPEEISVAHAKPTKFRSFVTVHAHKVGETDVVVYGSPKGRVVLRVLVRGVKPEPEWKAWLKDRDRDRRADRALKLIDKARVLAPDVTIVDGNTSRAVRALEVARELLAGSPRYGREATEAAQMASTLKERLDRRFTELAQRIADYRREGDYDAAVRAALDLRALFEDDPESVELQVVEKYYERLNGERIREERKRVRENR